MQGGEVIELVSDLGGGKTTFVRGLASGLGSQDQVHSPSFTLANQYQSGQLMIYHLDFYRLVEPGVMKDELQEILSDPTAIVVAEWPEVIQDVLPAKRVTVRIKPKSPSTREFTFTYPPELAHLIPNNT